MRSFRIVSSLAEEGLESFLCFCHTQSDLEGRAAHSVQTGTTLRIQFAAHISFVAELLHNCVYTPKKKENVLTLAPGVPLGGQCRREKEALMSQPALLAYLQTHTRPKTRDVRAHKHHTCSSGRRQAHQMIVLTLCANRPSRLTFCL